MNDNVFAKIRTYRNQAVFIEAAIMNKGVAFRPICIGIVFLPKKTLNRDAALTKIFCLRRQNRNKMAEEKREPHCFLRQFSFPAFILFPILFSQFPRAFPSL